MARYGFRVCHPMSNPDLGHKYMPLGHDIKPKRVLEAFEDLDWIIAMQEELNKFVRNVVWYLTERLEDKIVIGTKWIIKNKLDGHGIVIRNKSRLVAKGYA